MTAAGV